MVIRIFPLSRKNNHCTFGRLISKCALVFVLHHLSRRIEVSQKFFWICLYKTQILTFFYFWKCSQTSNYSFLPSELYLNVRIKLQTYLVTIIQKFSLSLYSQCLLDWLLAIFPLNCLSSNNPTPHPTPDISIFQTIIKQVPLVLLL